MPGINRTQLGPTVVVNGDITGDEDLVIEGHIRAAKIDMQNHSIVIGKDSTVEADVFAKTVVICGKVTGNVTALDEVDLPETGSLRGDISAKRVALAKHANFSGRITYT